MRGSCLCAVSWGFYYSAGCARYPLGGDRFLSAFGRKKTFLWSISSMALVFASKEGYLRIERGLFAVLGEVDNHADVGRLSLASSLD